MAESDGHLDILGQQPPLNTLYTQICLCYSVIDAASHEKIINRLTHGLEKLAQSYPWIAGRVLKESIEGSTGIYRMKPLEKMPRLIVRYLEKDPSAPSMYDLRQARFPFRSLDESLVAPRTTLPLDPTLTEWPVFIVQANFIRNGLLLNFNALHSVMDMTGQAHMIDMLSKACRNEDFTAEELSTGNLPRRDLVRLLDESYEPGPELALQTAKHALSTLNTKEERPVQPPQSSWAYFSFPSDSLAALKQLATRSLESGYVSTDDALSAYIWQAVIRARLPRLDSTTEVSFARAVDVRRYLDLPAKYPGLMQNMAYFKYTAQQLVEEPLGSVAAKFRAAVDPKTSKLEYHTRALTTAFARASDKSAFSPTAAVDASKDVMLSSWANVDLYELDFGFGLGRPESVRRPRFTPVESLFYLMPKSREGEIAAAICLRDEDMERLRADELFTQYGQYIG